MACSFPLQLLATRLLGFSSHLIQPPQPFGGWPSLREPAKACLIARQYLEIRPGTSRICLLLRAIAAPCHKLLLDSSRQAMRLCRLCIKVSFASPKTIGFPNVAVIRGQEGFPMNCVLSSQTIAFCFLGIFRNVLLHDHLLAACAVFILLSYHCDTTAVPCI